MDTYTYICIHILYLWMCTTPVKCCCCFERGLHNQQSNQNPDSSANAMSMMNTQQSTLNCRAFRLTITLTRINKLGYMYYTHPYSNIHTLSRTNSTSLSIKQQHFVVVGFGMLSLSIARWFGGGIDDNTPHGLEWNFTYAPFWISPKKKNIITLQCIHILAL